MAKLLEDYLSEEETAAELRIAKRTLRRWRRDKYGPPATLFGRQLRYYQPSVAAWLRSREEQAAA